MVTTYMTLMWFIQVGHVPVPYIPKELHVTLTSIVEILKGQPNKNKQRLFLQGLLL